ncbi:MAG: hypothetical protein WCB27_23060, partial [Thermoguttaceae bacterium]
MTCFRVLHKQRGVLSVFRGGRLDAQQRGARGPTASLQSAQPELLLPPDAPIRKEKSSIHKLGWQLYCR